MTVRQAVWLILRHSINQSEAETEAIELLKKQHPDLNIGISLAMDFADLVRRKAVRPRAADMRSPKGFPSVRYPLGQAHRQAAQRQDKGLSRMYAHQETRQISPMVEKS